MRIVKTLVMRTVGSVFRFFKISDSNFFCGRIWGEQGQAALENASICLLNCGATGSETLKNLVLGGIGSMTIVDGSKVEEADLGNNFMGILLLVCTLLSSRITFHL